MQRGADYPSRDLQGLRMEDAFNKRRDDEWIREALESGPEEPLSRAQFDANFRKAKPI